MEGWAEISLRLLLSTVYGALIGLEREKKNQPAGFRTHTILCVGAALVMILSAQIGAGHFDPGRIAAQVVSGIGFLGAGAIMKMGPTVKGLTTAASIWTVAMIGLAIGAGMYFEATAVTGILFLVLYLFNIIEKRLFKGKQGQRSLNISALDTPGLVGQITMVLEGNQVQLASIGISRNPIDGKVEISSMINMGVQSNPQRIIEELQAIPGLQEIDFH